MERRRFVAAAARRLAEACPAQARFLRWTLGNIEGKNENNPSQVCPFCFQFLLPGNHRVRLKPKKRISSHIQKLLNLEAKKYKLSFKQGKLLKKYKQSKNVLQTPGRSLLWRQNAAKFYSPSAEGQPLGLNPGLSACKAELITCNMCGKTTRHYGKSRECWSMKMPALGTPTPLHKSTPFISSHSGSKRQKLSPGSRTSTPGQSTPHLSSRSPKNTKSKFTRLKKLLSLEEHKKNNTVDLKNFLSTL